MRWDAAAVEGYRRFSERFIRPGDDSETRHLKRVLGYYTILGLLILVPFTVQFYIFGWFWTAMVNVGQILVQFWILACLLRGRAARPLFYVSTACLMCCAFTQQTLMGGIGSSGYMGVWAIACPIALGLNDLPGSGVYFSLFATLQVLSYALEPMVRAQAGVLASDMSRFLTFTNVIGSMVLLYFPLRFLNLSRRRLRQELDARTRALIEEQERRAEEAARRSKTDPLTGLPNRECFERDWVPLLVERGSCAFVALDLDHFKWVNDLHGHDAGDRALVKTAEIGAQVFRAPGGNLFRFGGEEFLAVLLAVGEEEALRKAEAFRAALDGRGAAELAAAGLRLQAPGPTGALEDRSLTVSIGVAFWPRHHADPREVMKLADEACYAAKRSGRNRVACHGGGAPAPGGAN